jgi:hypothetical protein
MIDKLAKLENANSAELASELYAEQHKLDAAWQRDRPTLPPTMYVLLGARVAPDFDLAQLATGGHDIVGSEDVVEKLEPLD